MSSRIDLRLAIALGALCCASGAALAAPAAAWPSATTGPAGGARLVKSYCGACHLPEAGGGLVRISEERKTPEGWVMTIFRMQNLHGLRLPAAARDVIVRYLADTRGLAPSEAAPARYALERRPNVPDMRLPGDLQVLCARCHSAARIALERRTSADWLKNANWHLAEFPTIEYQQNARDRHWWREASTSAPIELGKLFPLRTKAWSDWQHHAPIDLAGRWLVRGHEAGRGDYWGTAEIRRTAADEYRARYRVRFAGGAPVEGESHAILYTGYEWRGTATLGGRHSYEVFAASPNGQSLSGRWFLADHSEIGADWNASRAGGVPRILLVSPRSIRAGTSQQITIFGSHLAGRIDFGAGLRARVIHRGADRIVVRLTAAAQAAPGYRAVRVGGVSDPRSIAVYDRVDRLRVTPAFAIARLGGGKLDPVAAQFDVEAIEEIPGPHGAKRSVDLGALPVAWSIAPFDTQAARDRDVDFAGRIDSSGRFLPAVAGPDPKRKFHADNTGNLYVVATLESGIAGGPAPVVGKAHLVVTVQRWNTPPIY
ncbi:MAG TPA: quinohemoprotein amine dehydrogenase subunit alpha [Steroidobacteraceae bacterium]|nr:quinohemoprotein amine dehydrogenase subunit alpha [Steroidobacteraceae bacterium]